MSTCEICWGVIRDDEPHDCNERLKDIRASIREKGVMQTCFSWGIPSDVCANAMGVSMKELDDAATKEQA